MKYVKLAIAVIFTLGLFMGGLAFERFVLGKHSSFREVSKITMPLQVAQQITPKAYSAHLVFSSTNALLEAKSLEATQKQAIKESFNQINKLAKDSGFCQQTSYNLHPNYSFLNGKQELSGHGLNAVMICNLSTSKLDSYEKFKNKIVQIATQNGFFVLNTPALYPSMQDMDWTPLQNALLKKAQDKVATLSRELKKQCRMQHLNFFPDRGPVRFSAQELEKPAPQTFKLMAKLGVHCQ
ncbi:hypothetical protein [Helicobacter felis]|uniref:Periplasmic protein n=1 Tax=Helicobacter felis (strain ATCC 49179 / CCUG 28539 / NCTC 12436 / CS1) TaxID=936155 RepID=E7ACI7_HELFC|nr:hypothetical protein [Helicobacter felis]CBY82216.1 putative periplasmic protein [Helicobacter felis ATCC 49179]